MNNVDFALTGESYIASKLDEAEIRYWWNPLQRNFYGADFLTEYGIIDVKIGNPAKRKYVSAKTGKVRSWRYWKFNCHHHGIKQKFIDVYIFIVSNYRKNDFIYFVIPGEMVRTKTFSISAKQIKNGRYHYFINNWKILRSSNRERFNNKKEPNYKEIAKRLRLPYHRFYNIIKGRICAAPSEKSEIVKYFEGSYINIPAIPKEKITRTASFNWNLYKLFKNNGYNLKTLSEASNIPYQRLRLIVHGRILKIHRSEKSTLSKILRTPQKDLF